MPFPVAAAITGASALAAPLIGKAGAKAPPKQTAAMPMPSNQGAMASSTGNTGVNFTKPTAVTPSSYAQEKLKNTAPGGGYG